MNPCLTYQDFHNDPPIVFLDTNSVIEMVDGLLSKDQNHRGLKLFNFLKNSVHDGKLICPFVYQRDEYIKYFDEAKKKKCDDVLLSLGKGYQVRTVNEEVFKRQFKRMAIGYITKGDNFKDYIFDWSDIFDPESHKEYDIENDLGIKVIVLRTGHPDIDREVTEPNILKILEDRRKYVKDNNYTKEQIFEEERRGRLYDLKLKDEDRIKNYSTNINPNANIVHELSLNRTKQNLIQNWQEVLKETGYSDDDFYKLITFIHSEYFFDIPMEYISSVIYTEILFSDVNIKITDQRDVNALNVIFPYSSYAIVDKEMRAYICKSGLHKTFGVGVYGLDNVDKFIKNFSN